MSISAAGELHNTHSYPNCPSDSHVSPPIPVAFFSQNCHFQNCPSHWAQRCPVVYAHIWKGIFYLGFFVILIECSLVMHSSFARLKKPMSEKSGSGKIFPAKISASVSVKLSPLSSSSMENLIYIMYLCTCFCWRISLRWWHTWCRPPAPKWLFFYTYCENGLSPHLTQIGTLHFWLCTQYLNYEKKDLSKLKVGEWIILTTAYMQQRSSDLYISDFWKDTSWLVGIMSRAAYEYAPQDTDVYPYTHKDIHIYVCVCAQKPWQYIRWIDILSSA